MGMYDSKGNPHHSASRARMADDMAKEKSAPKPAAAPMKKTGSADGKGGEHDVSHMKIEDVVKQHGPAHEMHSTHDHEAGQHHVHTIHGEKHHHSDHDTAEDAMHHMRKAVGASMQEQPPDEAEETPDNEMMASGGSAGSMPGM
jgi:hypothetical protein